MTFIGAIILICSAFAGFLSAAFVFVGFNRAILSTVEGQYREAGGFFIAGLLGLIVLAALAAYYF